VDTRDSVFTLPAPAKPALVIFDKGNWLLKELNFTKLPTEWFTQAEYAANLVDRLRALHALSDTRDSVPCAALLARLCTSDRFWAVRQEAVTQLGGLHTADQAVRSNIQRALFAASKDKRSSVRAEALRQLAKFRDSEVLARLHDALNDSSYLVISAAVQAIARADSANALPTLIASLSVPSHRNIIAATALRSLEEVDSARALEAALKRMPYGQPDNLRYTALSILARQARHNKDLLPVLIPLARDKSRGIRQYALRILEEVGDATVLPVLDSIATETGNPMAARAMDTAKKVRSRLETP
jgi:HEAT repeat protein